MNDLQFLANACEMLLVPKTVLCTAQYYYHSCNYDLSEFEQFVVMAAILNIAVKQNEVQRKFRDLLNVCYFIHTGEFLAIDDKFWAFKSSIIKAEFLILRSLNFDTTVLLPHHFCIVILYQLENEMVNVNTWTMTEFQRLCQASLAIATETFNDAMVIPNMHDWDSRKDHAWNIAISSVFLGTKVLHLSYKNLDDFTKDWSSTKDVIESIMEKQVFLLQKFQANPF